MNYLAHAYLSFEDAEILAGNMISDFVKGKQKFTYSPRIQQGIHLHREIDRFTDTHPVVKEAKIFFQEPYRLYSGAFIDVVFDHYLAKHLNTQLNLQKFSGTTYLLLEKNLPIFPAEFTAIFPYMKSQDWLYHYLFKEGIQKSFTGLQKRAKYIHEVQSAKFIFEKYYEELEKKFTIFWKEMYFFAQQTYNSLSI